MKKTTKHLSIPRTTVKNKKQSKGEIKEEIKENRAKSFKTIKAKITRKSVRKFDISRVGKVIDILPKFIKFYDKLSPNEIMAIKFYKGHGSFFQSQLLTDHRGKNKDKNNDYAREFSFPFHLWAETRFRDDISPYYNELLPFNKSFDIKELSKYIETSYKARITLLNRLDKIYDRTDCPRLTGDEILFRGMQNNEIIKKLKVGDKYLFKNFISTTVDRNIAERFSGGETMFVLMGLKDIPFIFMPNSKAYGKDKFSKFMMEQEPIYDLSEYTLPRNLEFKIERIEKKPLGEFHMYGDSDQSFAKLHKVLKKQGYMDNKPNDNVSEETDSTTKPSKEELIEQNIFPCGKIYYCTLHNWYPRTPIIFEEITKNGKFVLDKFALDSWSRESTRFM